jgi:tetratricopeptide (TPR) repeat protein
VEEARLMSMDAGAGGTAYADVKAMLETAEAQQSQGQAAQALATLAQARQRAQAPGGDVALVAQVAVATAALNAAAGQGNEAMAALQQAAELFKSAGDRPSQIRALIQLAALQAGAGQVDSAKRLLQSCVDGASQSGDDQLIAEAHLGLGQLLLSTRYAAAAESEFRAGLAAATGLQDASAQVQLRAYLAVAVFQCGRAPEALSLLEEDATIASQIPDGIAGALALSNVSDALLAIQRPLDALEIGKQVMAQLKQTGAQPLIVNAAIGLANLYAVTRQPAQAAQSAQEAMTIAQQVGGPAGVASVQLRLGMMAMQRGDRPTAVNFLSQARRQLTGASLPQPPILAQLLAQLGS